MRLRLLALSVTALLAACSGGGSHSTLLMPPLGAKPVALAVAGPASLSVKLSIPNVPTKQARARKPQYVSAATNGVLVQVYASTDTMQSNLLSFAAADTSATSPTCTPTASGRDCLIVIPAAPTGANSDSFVFTAYSTPPVANAIVPARIFPAGTAIALSSGMVTQQITANTNNVINATLNGVVNAASVILSKSTSGNTNSVTASIKAYDASGALIVGGFDRSYTLGYPTNAAFSPTRAAMTVATSSDVLSFTESLPTDCSAGALVNVDLAASNRTLPVPDGSVYRFANVAATSAADISTAIGTSAPGGVYVGFAGATTINPAFPFVVDSSKDVHLCGPSSGSAPTVVINAAGDNSGHAIVVDNARLFASHIDFEGNTGSSPLIAAYPLSTLTLTYSTVAHGRGGGIALASGTIDHAYIALNNGYNGGGLQTFGSGTVSVTNSTFDTNNASNRGGAVYAAGGSITFINSTLTGNTGYDSSGIYAASGSVNVGFTTFSNNSDATTTNYSHDICGDVATINMAYSLLQTSNNGVSTCVSNPSHRAAVQGQGYNVFSSSEPSGGDTYQASGSGMLDAGSPGVQIHMEPLTAINHVLPYDHTYNPMTNANNTGIGFGGTCPPTLFGLDVTTDAIGASRASSCDIGAVEFNATPLQSLTRRTTTHGKATR